MSWLNDFSEVINRNNTFPFHHYFQHGLKNKILYSGLVQEFFILCLSAMGRIFWTSSLHHLRQEKMWLGENFVEVICNIPSMLIMYQEHTDTSIFTSSITIIYYLFMHDWIKGISQDIFSVTGRKSGRLILMCLS